MERIEGISLISYRTVIQMEASKQAGKLLRALREKEDISQAELGEAINRTKQTVSGAERAVRRITLERLKEFLRPLGYRLELVPIKEASDQSSEDYPNQSLKQVAELLRQDESFRPAIKELYRYIAHTKDPCSIYQKPSSVDTETDAYLAAIAERIANHYDWAVPQWTKQEDCFLTDPYYADAPEGMHEYLEEYSPPEFAKRNIFVDENTVTGQLEKYRDGLEEVRAAGA